MDEVDVLLHPLKSVSRPEQLETPWGGDVKSQNYQSMVLVAVLLLVAALVQWWCFGGWFGRAPIEKGTSETKDIQPFG